MSERDAHRGAGFGPGADFDAVLSARLSRRGLLRGALGAGAAASVPPARAQQNSAPQDAEPQTASAFAFKEIASGMDETHHVAEGYVAEPLLRWGDPLFPDAPPFDPAAQSAAAQARQFGYNNDYVGFIPLAPGRGLLVVNHEYVAPHLMFPGIASAQGRRLVLAPADLDRVLIEMAAHGASLVEIERSDAGWAVRRDGALNRRVTATTPMRLTGPAAGCDRLKTSADPDGRTVLGTLANCAGGLAPWGGFLTAEENFHYYFSGALPEGHVESANHQRFALPGKLYEWAKFDPRFDLSREPNEPNRFGWIVEIDPFDPASTPRKRTALGRFRHEAAETALARDGRVAVYMGDDERYEHVYKFVTAGRHDLANPAASRDLLDEGVLYAARFFEDGALQWLPLVFGTGPLTPENGFASQADVLIETRRAASLLGATRMDRPEDVQPNAAAGKVYVMLTGNPRRRPEEVDAANPRAANACGHILEIAEAEGDPAALSGSWEILARCGDPSRAEIDASFSARTTPDGWFAMPDNAAIDPAGRLWVATDGAGAAGRADGLYALDIEGAARGASKLFFRAPVGAEVCGPMLTPDGETLFLSVQHPGAGGEDFAPFGRISTYEDPATRWPDFTAGAPPRPSVLAIRRLGGGRIGG